MAAKKRIPSTRDQQRLRAQQIVLGVVGILVILSMVISLITR